MVRVNFYLLNYIRVLLLFAAAGIIIFLILNQKDDKNLFKLSKSTVRGDTSAPNKYNRLAERYLTTELEMGRAMASRGAFFSKSMGYLEGEAKAYFILAQYNLLDNNDEKAIDFADKAYNIYVKINDYKGATLSKQIEGRIFLKHEMFEQAQDLYKSSLTVAKDLANNELMAICYTDFGGVLMAKKKYSEAIEYFKKASKIHSKIQDKKGLAVCYTYLGLTYKAQRKYHDATMSFEQALALLPDEDNQKAFVYIEAGTVEQNKFNYTKALAHFKQAEVIEAAHEDNFDLAATLYKQAETYMMLSKLDMALSTSHKGAQIAQLVGNKEVQRDLYHIISEIYTLKEDYKNALSYLKASSNLDADIRSETQVKQISKRQASLEFNEKLELEKLNEKKLQEQLNEQVQNHYLMIGMFIPLMVTLIFFISKINISANYIRAIVFVTIILILEFLLVVLDPYIDKYTGGIPISKLIINTILALMLAPLQHIMEKYIKKRVIEAKMEQKKSTITI